MNNEKPSLEELLERDKEAIEQLQKAREGGKVEPEWVLLAEFGLYFGWQAVKDVREDRLSFEELNKMLSAARKIKAMNRYNEVMDIYLAYAAVHDKKGAAALKETLKSLKRTW